MTCPDTAEIRATRAAAAALQLQAPSPATRRRSSISADRRARETKKASLSGENNGGACMRPPKKGKFQSLKARMQGPRANHRHGESGTEQNNRLRESSIVFLVLAGGSRNEDGGAGGTRPWPSLCLNNGRGGGARSSHLRSFLYCQPKAVRWPSQTPERKLLTTNMKLSTKIF